MKEIPLSQGKKTLVCEKYYDVLTQRKWCYKSSGLERGYAVTTINGRLMYMHVYLAILEWKVIPEGCEVDHRNGDRLDNRVVENLRLATKCQNRWNRAVTKGKKSCNYKGVSYRKELKSRPWVAVIQANHERHHLGYFATAEEAAEAYNEACERLHGEFGRTNEIQDYGQEG